MISGHARIFVGTNIAKLLRERGASAVGLSGGAVIGTTMRRSAELEVADGMDEETRERESG